MDQELDLILRLRYQFIKNQEFFIKNDKKKIDDFYNLLDKLETSMKNLLKNNS